MNSDTLLVVLTIFVAVSTVALLVQAAMLYGMFRATRQVQQQLAEMMPKVSSTLAAAQATLEHSREQVQSMTAKANEVIEMARVQLGKLDVLLTDATGRAKVQMDRAEIVVGDTIDRVHESVSLVHQGIVKPLREINGIANGVRAALQHLMAGQRPHVNQATQDEEMFI